MSPLLAALFAVTIVLVVGLVLSTYRARKEAESHALERAEQSARLNVVVKRLSELTAGPAPVDDEVRIRSAEPPPEPPPELVQACAGGECVLFVGPGLFAQTEVPTAMDMLTGILRRLSVMDPNEEWAGLLHRLETGESPTSVAAFVSATADRAALREAMSAESSVMPGVVRVQPRLAQAMNALRPAGIITTVWQDLDPAIWGSRASEVQRVDIRSNRFGALLRERQPFEMHLFGSLVQPDSLLLSEDDYRTALFESPTYVRFIADLLSLRTVLFLGAGRDAVAAFFEGPRLRSRPARDHFALVSREPSSDLEMEVLERRYGVHPLEVEPSKEATREFVETLARRVAPGGRRLPRVLSPEPQTLERVSLRNVGPFAELDIDLAGQWTVLLGDNGCGKSTVLRAIGLALAGEDQRVAPAAMSLLRAGARSGTIELTVGGSTLRTDLVREAERRVRIAPERSTPLEAGRWLVLGFPPLRGPSGGNPSGVSSDETRDPDVDDVLPLVLDQVDQRLGSLKQWLVNTQVRADRGSRGARAVRDAFFEIANELVPGVGFRFSRLDESSWEILLRLGEDDKGPELEVPLDRISQGMSSTLAWVGTLLQRLYDLYPDDPEPSSREALVLLDEVDAHLHPSWQLAVVPALRKRFERVQFVATTHSALVVLNTLPGEVIQLRREADRIDAVPITQSFAGLRADQALVGPGFDLHSARDAATTKLYDEYLGLLGRPDRDEGMERRIRELAEELDHVLASPGDTAEAREGRRLVEKTMEAELRQMTEAEQRRVLAEVERYYLQIKSDG